MVVVVQLVRTPDCGSGGRGFKSHHPPLKLPRVFIDKVFGSLLLKNGTETAQFQSH